jgi:serine/threonine-protein kinase
LLFLLIVPGASLAVVDAQARDRREEMLQNNRFVARWVAGTVVHKIGEYYVAVARAADEIPREALEQLRQRPGVRTEENEDDPLQSYCEKLHAAYRAPGVSRPSFEWFILDLKGIARARWPTRNRDYVGKDYPWRDYAKGALGRMKRSSRLGHVSRAFFSESSQTERFAVSAPIYDEAGQPVGVMVAMADTGAGLGTLELKANEPSGPIHIAVLAPRDNDRQHRDDSLPDDYVVLLHDALDTGRKVDVERRAIPLGVQQERTLPDDAEKDQLAENNASDGDAGYCDPVLDGDCREVAPHQGRWLAGFAPVGNTGFVVVVETPRDAASQPNHALGRRLLLWGALPFSLGTGIFVVVLLLAGRRAARLQARSRLDEPLAAA